MVKKTDSTNSVSMNFRVPSAVKDDLSAIADMTEKTMTEIVVNNPPFIEAGACKSLY